MDKGGREHRQGCSAVWGLMWCCDYCLPPQSACMLHSVGEDPSCWAQQPHMCAYSAVMERAEPMDKLQPAVHSTAENAQLQRVTYI